MILIRTEKKITITNNSIGKPVLRWAGGKRRLLSHIINILPKNFNNYYEPFLGGGALFFRLNPSRAILSDMNNELINFYSVLRDNSDELIKIASKFRVNEADYYKIRSSESNDLTYNAARFLYLNKTCFNGLYRVNSKNEYNVPYGKQDNVQVVNRSVLLDAKHALKSSQLLSGDFDLISSAEKEDLVYLDPPYTVMHNKNGFIEYNQKIFSWNDQIRLRNLVLSLTEKGVYVIVSNAHHESIKELYKGFNILEICRSSTISGHMESRSKSVLEYLILNYELMEEEK